MSGPLRDLVHAWRGLKQKPGFLIGALLTLAIGISANVTIFSLVNGHQPPADAVRRSHRSPRDDSRRAPAQRREPDWGDTEISYADFLDFRKASTVEGIGGVPDAQLTC